MRTSTDAKSSRAGNTAVDGLTHQWPESTNYNASIRVVGFLFRFTRP
jgi:hypothetical protein